MGDKPEVRPAHTPTTTFVEPPDRHARVRFERTALIIDPRAPNTGSVDVLDGAGHRLAQINISFGRPEGERPYLIVDVIDVDDQWGERRALTFDEGRSRVIDCGSCNLASVDFRGKR